MKPLLRIFILISLLAGQVLTAQAQKKADRTSSGRAAYGNTVPEFRAHKKKNKKSKKKAIKRKRATNKRSSYFSGRPY